MYSSALCLSTFPFNDWHSGRRPCPLSRLACQRELVCSSGCMWICAYISVGVYADVHSMSVTQPLLNVKRFRTNWNRQIAFYWPVKITKEAERGCVWVFWCMTVLWRRRSYIYIILLKFSLFAPALCVSVTYALLLILHHKRMLSSATNQFLVLKLSL